MKQQRAQVGFLIGPGNDPKEISNVGVGGARSSVERLPDRAQAHIRRDDGNGASDRGSVHAITRERPDSRRTPQRCGGVESRNVQAVTQDDPGAQEADARDNLPGDSITVVRTCGKRGQHDKHRGPCRDESVRAQSGHALPPLPFGADEGSQNQGQSQANCEVMPKHFSDPFFSFSERACAHPRRIGLGEARQSMKGDSCVNCRVGSIQRTAKTPTRSGYGVVRGKASERYCFRYLRSLRADPRGFLPPGGSSSCVRISIYTWRCLLLPYPTGVGINL